MCESWVFIISTLFRGQLLLVKLEIVIVTLDSVLGVVTLVSLAPRWVWGSEMKGLLCFSWL